MRPVLRAVSVRVLLLNLVGLAALTGLTGCTSSAEDPRAGAAAPSAASSSAAADLPGAPLRFDSASELAAAVVAAATARGSVLITTTAPEMPVVNRKSVQLVPGGENEDDLISTVGEPDQSLLIASGVPYLPIAGPGGKHWQQTDFLSLATAGTWEEAVSSVGLPAELASWGLATALSGGDARRDVTGVVRTYTLTLGPQAAAAEVLLDRLDEAERADVSRRLATVSFDITVTLGPDDLPRTVSTPDTSSGLTRTDTYTDWGEVTVSAPRPDDVVTS